MAWAVLLALIAGVFWIAFVVLQFVALLSLITLGLAMWVVLAIYGLSFAGLYLILGPEQAGWAVFGAMFLGTVLLRAGLRRLG